MKLLGTKRIPLTGQAVSKGVIIETPNALVVASLKSQDRIEFKQLEDQSLSTNTLVSLLIILFLIVLPHGVAALIEYLVINIWNLQSIQFHLLDGIIKATLLVGYLFFIRLLPEISSLLENHGAEHRVLSIYEAGEELTVENAKKYTNIHPMCGTTLLCFFLFFSTIIFSIILISLPIAATFPFVLSHILALTLKLVLIIPIAGVSYGIFKFLQENSNSFVAKIVSTPGMVLQKLTTKTPSDDQLKVGISAILAALSLEKNISRKQNYV
ncbi:MAG: DUF1385 domain-containing protein [Bacteriovoracaceae bacterium]|nr:DUF1385 domain-containing protein [Bacteriovoracaceae bacterium]